MRMTRVSTSCTGVVPDCLCLEVTHIFLDVHDDIHTKINMMKLSKQS